MAKSILGVSWLNGSFKAVAFRGGVAAGTWTCPLRVEKLEELKAVLSQAVTETRFMGNEVVFVLEHRSLIYHLQETPPAKRRVVRQLLDRAVVQNKFFEEPAVWGSQPAPSAKGRLRHVLNIIPRSLLDGLTAACRELELELRGVFPATAVLSGQLDKLSGDSSTDTVLLAADLAGVLCLMVGGSDGQILFSRLVVGLSLANRERVEQEINRTLLYSQQQFGVSVNRLWVFGDGAQKLLEVLPARDALSVGASPVAEDEFYTHAKWPGFPSTTPPTWFPRRNRAADGFSAGWRRRRRSRFSTRWRRRCWWRWPCAGVNSRRNSPNHD